MDCSMTVATNRNRLLHLLARKSFLEPFIAVASAGDQMVFRGPAFRDPATETALGVV